LSQHDYILDNALAAAFRTDINNALQAVVSVNSGAAYPATTYANMLVYRTDTNNLEKRNEANSAWIVLGNVDEGLSKFNPNQTVASSALAIAGTDNVAPITSLGLRSGVSVVLSTLATTSGTNVTFSGLDLTTFRELHIAIAGVSSTAVAFLSLASIQVTPALGSAGAVLRGSGIIELASGVACFNVASTATGAAMSVATPYCGALGITTATTSLSFDISSGTFDAGAIKLVGYR
jgi:hypothetical protein